ncbi:MAG: ABC transporter substrate-binding protein [Oscillospiraceae bacterium]|nr:ABC transporter substrate-binding protein [Oscillospiraceae bacterium]
MKKSFIALLITALLLPAMSACSSVSHIEEPEIDEFIDDIITEEVIPRTEIIIGVTGMTGNFSPFYGNAGDNEVMSVINVPLVTLDRRGEVVRNAATGEWRSYNGEEYYYEGVADTSISITENNTTVLTFRLREDVYFSDGANMTAADIIFTLRTLLDADYSGRHAGISLLPIEGLENYITNASREVYEKYAEIAASGQFTDEQYELYLVCEQRAWLMHIYAVAEYCVQNYADFAHVIADGDIHRDEWLQAALAMMVWRVADFPLITPATDEREAEFGNFTSISGREWDFVNTFPAVRDMYAEFYELYNGDLQAYIESEKIGQPWLDNVLRRAELLFISESAAQDEENSGVSGISGVRRLGDYEVEVTLEGHIPAAVYSFVFPVVPQHYSGTPLGAGPYKLIGYGNGVAALEANEFYYKGAPETQYICFKETNPGDLIYGVASGTLDITAAAAERGVPGEINAYGASGIKTQGFDFGAFGFIGINAERVSISGEPLSEESVNFRKGIATVLAAYRDISVWDFYEGAAGAAQYPAAGVSWAAPREWDSGFRTAYDTDVNGDEIYDGEMNEARRFEAAGKAALGFFEAAGCTINESGTAISEFPEGVSGDYEVYVAGFGSGRHPSFLLLTMAAEALRAAGINIIIIDVPSQAQMYEVVFGGTADMWCAAWQGEILSNAGRVFKSAGEENFFRLSDEMIDQRIDLAGTTLNLEFYKNIFDAVLESAVCIPIYQRQKYYLFGASLLQDTVEADLTAHYGWADILWKVKIA